MRIIYPFLNFLIYSIINQQSSSDDYVHYAITRKPA